MRSEPPAFDTTLSHYEENADEFVESTVDVDMGPLYERFLPLIPSGGHILDAGCGSGRDSLAFLKAGFRVTAFDASEALAERAGRLIAQAVEVATFQSFHSDDLFDGVWACASLLHVPLDRLSIALGRLTACTRMGGVIYMSFKLGSGERVFKGRFFTDMNAEGLTALLKTLPELRLKETWITGDRRPGRENEGWFNAILVKVDSRSSR